MDLFYVEEVDISTGSFMMGVEAGEAMIVPPRLVDVTCNLLAEMCPQLHFLILKLDIGFVIVANP